MADPPTVFITGATSGIGLELTRYYASLGFRLALLGRRPLSECQDPLFTSRTYCQVDLRAADRAEQVLAWLQRHDIRALTLLVNNAAMGWYGAAAEQSETSIRDMMAVNVQAPLALSHALLPHLRAGEGKLVFISSVSVAMPTADYAVYTASKAAIDGLARNLTIELEGQVAVQVIHPGPTRTPMHLKSGVPQAKSDAQAMPSAAQTARSIAAIISQDPALGDADATVGMRYEFMRFAGKHFAAPLHWLLRYRRRNPDARALRWLESKLTKRPMSGKTSAEKTPAEDRGSAPTESASTESAPSESSS